MNRTVLVLAAVPVMALTEIPGTVEACSLCGFSMVERSFPPAVPWTVTGLFLYPLVAWWLRPDGTPVDGLFAPVRALLIVGFCWFGTYTAGPPGGLVLPALGLLGLGAVLVWNGHRLPGQRILDRILAGVVIALLATTAVVWSMGNSRRDDVAYILRWEGTAQSEFMTREYVRTGDVATLRRLVEARPTMEGARAAEALGRQGKPVEEAPRILDAMERAAAEPDTEWLVMHYANALEESLARKPHEKMRGQPAAWRVLVESLPWDKAPTAAQEESAS